MLKRFKVCEMPSNNQPPTSRLVRLTLLWKASWIPRTLWRTMLSKKIPKKMFGKCNTKSQKSINSFFYHFKMLFNVFVLGPPGDEGPHSPIWPWQSAGWRLGPRSRFQSTQLVRRQVRCKTNKNNSPKFRSKVQNHYFFIKIQSKNENFPKSLSKILNHCVNY